MLLICKNICLMMYSILACHQTKEEKANWNAKSLIHLHKHRAKKSKAELQAQNRKYKQTFKAKQKAKLVNNTQSADAKLN